MKTIEEQERVIREAELKRQKEIEGKKKSYLRGTKALIKEKQDKENEEK
jgi:hypothetical protein